MYNEIYRALYYSYSTYNRKHLTLIAYKAFVMVNNTESGKEYDAAALAKLGECTPQKAHSLATRLPQYFEKKRVTLEEPIILHPNDHTEITVTEIVKYVRT